MPLIFFLSSFLRAIIVFTLRRLPSPSAPSLKLLPSVLVDGFLIALISYTSAFSMAKIFAQRKGYTVDATQELYAQVIFKVSSSTFVDEKIKYVFLEEEVATVVQ